MTGKERADLGFEAAIEGLSLDEWTPTKKTSNDRPPKEVTEKVAKEAGFTSREPKVQTAPDAKVPQPKGRGGEPRSENRYRTGRNAQLSIKATPEAIEDFNAICKQQNWQQGVTIEHANVLLREAIAAGRYRK